MKPPDDERDPRSDDAGATRDPDPLPHLPRRELPGGLTLLEARTLRSRLRGVSGLAGLPSDHGLSLPAGSIHTWTVRFPLDLIWLDRDGGVLRVDRGVPRWRVRACRGAKSVVEVTAGAAAAFVEGLAAERTGRPA